MEGDDISTRIVQDDFPKTILVTHRPVQPVEPVQAIDWAKEFPKPPRPSLFARLRARLAAWWDPHETSDRKSR